MALSENLNRLEGDSKTPCVLWPCNFKQMTRPGPAFLAAGWMAASPWCKGHTMIRRVLDWLYGSVPAVFESAFGFEESVRQLAMATERSALRAIGREVAIGSVSGERVSIYKAHQLFTKRSIKTVFTGRFHEVNGRVSLTGRFSMPLQWRIFMSIWFGFCFAWIGGATISLMRSGAKDDWWLPLVGIVILAIGAGSTMREARMAKNDETWLSNAIADALSSPHAS